MMQSISSKREPERTAARLCVRQATRVVAQLVEQRLCLFEVRRIEAFGEPAVDRRQKVAGFGGATLVAAQPSEARRGAQFPELGVLLPGDAQGFAIELVGGLGMPLSQQQLALVPV